MLQFTSYTFKVGGEIKNNTFFERRNFCVHVYCVLPFSLLLLSSPQKAPMHFGRNVSLSEVEKHHEEHFVLFRIMYTECSSSLCPCGDVCGNQKIQRHQWSPGLEKFVTKDRGFGIRTALPIKEGLCGFLSEYE